MGKKREGIPHIGALGRDRERLKLSVMCMLIIFGFKDFWRIVVLEILNKRQRGALRWSTAFSSDVAL